MGSLSGKKEKCKSELSLLLDEFDGMYKQGMFSGKSEATARTWIERFLVVFGWNPADPGQVRQEHKILGRAARKLKAEKIQHNRPDYCLLSHGQRLLYLDAKRFDADIKEDSGVSFQVRCYGWSEGFKVSYAFDFSELAIYDCRIKPKDSDDGDIARVTYLQYTEYLSQFDLLWDYFAKEAIDSGSINRRHPDDEKPEGSRPLDEDFEEKLSEWRKGLAKTILRYGKIRDSSLISAAAQRILDRIIFLRICEEIGFEELGTLMEMGRNEDGFWPLFLEGMENRYCKVYDGILFPASGEDDPTGVESHLRTWWLRGKIFREIVDSLYYPNPYRFDVVPIELLGGIYERYLGKKLRVVGNDVTDEFKFEYQRTKGAVYTPRWVVRKILERTLDPLTEGLTPGQLLQLKILDPSCGSASFLLGVFEYLVGKIEQYFEANPNSIDKGSFLVKMDEEWNIRPEIAYKIINECIYGVDIDPEAVEVARMSLALRYLEKTSVLTGEPNLLLNGIGLNIRQGNSLVGPDVVGLLDHSDKVVKECMPFDWYNPKTGFGAVMQTGGFDAIVGNPPYIEVKRYKDWMPSQYEYLKESGNYETTLQGKTDIAMPFMERGLTLLKPSGRLGYIIQNRFFKTEYGESVRSWLIKHKGIAEIHDFRDIQIFPKRTTYTAIMILQKNCPDIKYRTYLDYESAFEWKPSVESKLDWKNMDSGIWAFDQPDLLEVYEDLVKRHGTIGSHPELQISVGLQTLYGKVYQLEPIEVKPRTIIGLNGFGDQVTVERAATRPLCRNRGFYPFRQNNADAWVIFPYDVEDGKAKEIEWKEFKERFPKTADYLEEKKKVILKDVETEKGPNRWHLYTYPKNIVSQAVPKVLFPMTIEDTMATVDLEGDVYQDNVRVNSISSQYFNQSQLVCLAAVLNSSVFNALAKVKAGMSDSGWRQLNKQFLDPMPFPVHSLNDKKTVDTLSSIASKIMKLQEQSIMAENEGEKQAYKSSLDSLWNDLDKNAEDFFQLTDSQKEIIRKYPRRVNRVDLLTRQVENAKDDEE